MVTPLHGISNVLINRPKERRICFHIDALSSPLFPCEIGNCRRGGQTKINIIKMYAHKKFNWIWWEALFFVDIKWRRRCRRHRQTMMMMTAKKKCVVGWLVDRSVGRLVLLKTNVSHKVWLLMNRKPFDNACQCDNRAIKSS